MGQNNNKIEGLKVQGKLSMRFPETKTKTKKHVEMSLNKRT